MVNDVLELTDLLSPDEVQLLPKLFVLGDELLYLVELFIELLKLAVCQLHRAAELLVK